MKKGNGSLPAFPPALAGVGGGLTKREWFAGLAMQALLADPKFEGDAVSDALEFADDMLVELEKDNAE